MQLKTVRMFSGLTVSLIFLVAILTPLLVMKFSDTAAVSMVEKRRLERLPAFTSTLAGIKEYTRQYERFFNDHFGLRSHFVRLYNSLFVALLHTSPSFDVLVGKEQWLYLTTWFAYRDYTGNTPSSPARLQKWKQILVERKRWLNEQGIQYLLLPVPYKISVYTEFLPDRIQAIEGQTDLARFLDLLEKQPAFADVLDFKKIFMEAKKKERVYYKTDSHWNFVGAYIAYTKIIEHLQPFFPEMRPYPRDKLLYSEGTKHGNLTKFINIGKLYEEIDVFLTVPDEDKTFTFSTFDLPPQPDETFQDFRHGGSAKLSVNPGKSRTAVVITDSFGSALENFLAMNFSRIVFVRDARFEDMMHLIEREQPDVVLDINGSTRFDVAMGESVQLRNESVRQVFEDHKPFFQVTPENIAEKTKKITGAEYVSTGQGIAVQSHIDDPQLVFDVPAGITEEPLYIHCQLYSPADTLFQVFFQTEEDPSYTERKMVAAKVRQGENDIYLRIYDSVLLDRLRVDFGAVTGRYVIRSFDMSF